MDQVSLHGMESTPSLPSPYSRSHTLAVRKFDIATSSAFVVGRHSDGEKFACSCLASVGDNSLVASAGWDSRFHLWDQRTSGTAVSSITLPGKGTSTLLYRFMILGSFSHKKVPSVLFTAFAMDFDPTHSRIVVGTAGRRICFLDVRNNKAELVLNRESSLKYQTRTVKFFPQGVGIALGSIEGRVAIEFLDDLGIKSGAYETIYKHHCTIV